MNRRPIVVPFLTAALLLLGVVAVTSPANAQRCRHYSRGSSWGISISFGSPRYDDDYCYDRYSCGDHYDGYRVAYYSRPVHCYRHPRHYYVDYDYGWRRHDRGRHCGWYKHRW